MLPISQEKMYVDKCNYLIKFPLTDNYIRADTRRNNNVVSTSKRRCDVVLT